MSDVTEDYNNDFKGLYILIHLILESFNVFKFGMSMRLDHRLYDGDYTTLLNNPKYHCIFKIKNLCSRNIKFLEQKVLNNTLNYKSKNWGGEVREGISREDFIEIVKGILTKYGVIYEIEDNPEFSKPDRVIKENIDEIEPLEMIPIEEGIQSNDIELIYDYQKETHEKLKNYQKCIINWACGGGKTYISLYQLQEYKYKTVLIAVPTNLLLEQWVDKIKEMLPYYEPLIINSSQEGTTDQVRIREFTNAESEYKCIINNLSLGPSFS